MVAAWSIAHGHTDEHARELKRGLGFMRPGFAARICGACDGHGEYQQMFTHGCGGGYYHSLSGCDNCDGSGLMQGDRPAPASVREQVLVAARRYISA